jgi:hypothetical protein
MKRLKRKCGSDDPARHGPGWTAKGSKARKSAREREHFEWVPVSNTIECAESVEAKGFKDAVWNVASDF